MRNISKPVRLVTVLINVLYLLVICSLPLHADIIAPDNKPRRSIKRNQNGIFPNDGKHAKKESRQRWPGQGDAKVERARKCVRNRESRGNYRIADKKGKWFGAYQLSIQTSNTAAKKMNRKDLVGVPANKWSRSEQDAAFYIIYNRGFGKRHFIHYSNKCF